MPTTKIRGVEIVYRVVGRDGPWLALTPGGRRSHDEILSVAERIAAAGFQVLLHDRRNTGASEIAISGDENEEAIWADDLASLLKHLEATPAFIGGFSSGSRVSMMVASRHPEVALGLLLCRVTGGPVAAARLPEKYYGQFIKAAEQGGMHGVIATPDYQERVAANPANRDRILSMDKDVFLATMRLWRDQFVAGAHYEVMGVSPATLASIQLPTLVVPGNDQTHSLNSGLAAQRDIPNAELHRLAIEQEDRDIIPWNEWNSYEAEIASAFISFMNRVFAGSGVTTQPSPD